MKHAHIDEKVRVDLDILGGLAQLAERLPEFVHYRPRATVAEFQRMLRREMDFCREERNMQQFARNFLDDETVHFPVSYTDTSAHRVLTMEMLDGISVSDTQRLRESNVDLNEFALRGANMYLEMIFRDGFYHADPHPGNLLVLADGVVGVLDCGMVGRVDEQLREDFEGMLLAAVNRDAEDLTDYVVRLGSVPPDFDRDALRTDAIASNARRKQRLTKTNPPKNF